MIYLLVGADIKKRNSFLKTLVGKRESIRLTPSQTPNELLYEYAQSTSLFGESPFIVLDNILSQSDINLSDTDLKQLKDSPTFFIFLEDKLLAAQEKKYKKHATIERFDTDKDSKQAPKINTFDIANAFARRDKVGTWILYRNAVEQGIEPEPLSGMLFWKIKSLMLTGARLFTADELKKQSSDLVALYHRSHRGECDFVVGLEQFILSSLAK
jgi:DNA polymerase III delta subunit